MAVSHPTHLSNTHFPHTLPSATSSQILLSLPLSSAIRIWSLPPPCPISFLAASHFTCPWHPQSCFPALIPSPPWARSVLTPRPSHLVTIGIKFSRLVVWTWSSHTSRFASFLQSVAERLLLALALLSVLSFMPFLSPSFSLSPSATFLEVPLLTIHFVSEGFHH